MNQGSAASKAFPAVNLKIMMINVEVAKMIPEAFAREHEVLALVSGGGCLRVAMKDPGDSELVKKIEALPKLKGLKIQPVSSPDIPVKEVLDSAYPK